MEQNENQASVGGLIQWLKSEPLYLLLLAIPVAVVLEFAHGPATAVFVVSGLAIVPLAGLMGRATENLAATMGAGIGGLLNATFGNAAELIIALIALSKGPEMYPLVKASLTGSIIGNVLLVLGLSMLLGGMKFPRQVFNRTAAGMGATLMALAGIALVIPAVFYHVMVSQHKADPSSLITLSEEIAVVLAVTYVLSLIFSLKTHQHLFAGEGEHEEHEPEWSRPKSLWILVAATVGVAIMSEFLIGAVDQAASAMGMTQVFVGVIVVAIVGNAAEHSTAVLVAMKDKMDLAFNIAVGSSLQIALFVAPVLVFASLLMGEPLDLHFTVMEVLAVVASIMVLSLVAQDGESHWMEGVMLLAVYLLLALVFFHLRGEVGAHAPADH